MTVTPEKESQALELAFDLVAAPATEVRITFFKVPRFAMDQIGAITVDWGDGSVESVDCTISDAELQRMARDIDYTALHTVSHRVYFGLTTRIRITTESGWLPLRALPVETTRIATALPRLTRGRTDKVGNLLPAKKLPQLVQVKGENERSSLSEIPSNFFAENPELVFFDKAFFRSAIRSVDATLFNPIRQIDSLCETFAGSALESVPEGFLKKVHLETLCSGTFAHCSNLKEVMNPFGDTALPFVMDDFLDGAVDPLFSWAPKERRAQMGWVRPKSKETDPAMRFVWNATGKKQTVLSFYPIDLPLAGDWLIDWGDEVRESINFEGSEAISHTWEKPGRYTISLHAPAVYCVRPFHFGSDIVEILDPLPKMHPRTLKKRRNFSGWAANLRLLERVTPNLFCNNPEIANLEQCFAGCVHLKDVGDDILSPLRSLKCADAMFAFCYSLERLPRSFAEFKRDTELDCFAQASDAPLTEKKGETA